MTDDERLTPPTIVKGIHVPTRWYLGASGDAVADKSEWVRLDFYDDGTVRWSDD